MRATFQWLSRRIAAGSAVGLLAMALATPTLRGQISDSDLNNSNAGQQTETDDNENRTDKSSNDNKSGTNANATRDREKDASTASSRTTTKRDDTTRPSFETTRDRRESARDTAREARDTAREGIRDTRESARDTIRDRREDARDTRRTGRETARDTARDSREDVRDTADDARDMLRDDRREARETGRDARRWARDTTQDAREDARDTARDTREWARDTRREYRDDWRDTSREAREQARDANRETRQDRDIRGEFRDFARDTARDAADYGRRTAREALDTARDTSADDREGQWEDFGRDTARTWRDFGTDTALDARDEVRDERTYDRDRDFDRDSSFARDRDRFGDDRQTFSGDVRDRRDRDADFRDTRGTFRRSDRDSRSFEVRSRDRDDLRVSRSQIQNFRANRVSANDLGLRLSRSSRGLIVDQHERSPVARTIGLREGDRILSVADDRVTSEDHFVRTLFDEDLRFDRVTVMVLRDGREVPIYVRPVELIEELIVAEEDYDPLRTFGLVLDDRYDDYIIVRRVLPNTPAFRAGLRSGDVVIRFDGRRISTPRQFVRVLDSADADQVAIEVERDRRLHEFRVSLPVEQARTTSQRRTTYRRDLDDNRFDDRDTQWQDRRTLRSDVRSESFETWPPAAPAGVLTTEPGQQMLPGQYQPAQPVLPSSRADDDRPERRGLLPRLFNR